jgi:hypothetical protein
MIVVEKGGAARWYGCRLLLVRRLDGELVHVGDFQIATPGTKPPQGSAIQIVAHYY